MADAHGFPELTSNPVYGENFDAALAGGQGIEVKDPSTGLPSPLVIDQAFKFTMGAKLVCDGFFAAFLQGKNQPFTITYFLESLTGGTTQQFAVNLNTNQGVAAGGQIVYDTTITTTPQISASTVPTGTYRLTASHNFGGALPFSAYVTGPVIDIFS